MVLMLRRNDSGIEPTGSAIDFEDNILVDNWRIFRGQARLQIEELRDMVRLLRARGKTVAGLGASAKSTVWINACGFTKRDISFIADSTQQKLYKCSPGSDIPIIDEGALLRELPDYTIMFCWNFRDEVIRNNQLYLSMGGRFIVPVPIIRVEPPGSVP